jgi:uncharacterized protein YjbI with pentapeptide repeats
MTGIASEQEYVTQTFSELSLAGEAITRSEFDACRFHACDITQSRFSNCRFVDCVFEQCNFSLCDIALSRFSDAVFTNCKLVGVDWTTVSWPDFKLPATLRFEQCVLNDASFYGLHLDEIQFIECKMHDADFRESSLCEASFDDCDLTASLFQNCDLSSASFIGASNYDIDVFNNRIRNARFSRFEAVRLLHSLDIELVDE